ncbi:MAG: succinyl-diaminopimelate desuccinylase [Propionibacteriaceae bacterium]|jgi:succinyl-diaminopimelate desuccinylase|nr:succinyl-diaminopimelate desuccinylase [Propionibacteriaceae bacterium]
MGLELGGDLVALLRAIVDIESVSGNEKRLADEIAEALRAYPHLEVLRDQDLVVARTNLGRERRVVVAGHIDTVPVAANLPSYFEDGRIYGRGSCDMKAGVAVMLAAAAALKAPKYDVTWIFYDHEEVAAELNGLGRLDPELLQGELAILMEPTSAQIEGGCQGTLRFNIKTKGRKAHAGRAWLGHNAIHDAADVLFRLYRYKPREVSVDGLVYKEGLNAVAIRGGVAVNVIPDECVITINFRFAPDRDEADAKAFIAQTFTGYVPEYIDFAPGARPGLDRGISKDFAETIGGKVSPKYGWTDVARFSALGIPAVNYGPGDPGKAHADDEFCPVEQLRSCHAGIIRYLG